MASAKELRTGEATASFRWDTPEHPGLAPSGMKETSVATLSLQDAAFMAQGIMVN